MGLARRLRARPSRGRAGRAAFAVALAAVATGASGCGADGEPTADGKAVFAKAGCGQCHALKDADAVGTIGPDLDRFQPNKPKVEMFVRNGVPPQMPSFEGQLTDDEIEAVADYVSEVTGGNDI